MNEATEFGNLLSERNVLGSIILENGLMSEATEHLSADDFYLEGHRLIYGAMIDLYEAREPIEFGTLWIRLKERGVVEKAGGAAGIAALVDGVSRTDSIAYYVKQMKRKSLVRDLARAANAIVEKCFDDPDDPELIATCQRMFWNACDAHLPTGFVSLGDAAMKYLEHVQEMTGSEMAGISSGFADIDRHTLGLQKKDLIVIAARPSFGKTTLSFNMALNAAIAGHPVAYFSIEMADMRIGEKMVSLGALVDSMQLRRGNVAREIWPDLIDIAHRASDLPFKICDMPRINTAEIKAKCERMKREMGLGLIAVDYLQLMAGDEKAKKFEKVGENVNELKAIAKELDVPLILLSQLSRDIEKRGQHAEPVLSDLGESGEIERTADVIIFLYDDGEPMANAVSVKIGKNRTGATGNFKMLYQKQYNRFGDLRQ